MVSFTDAMMYGTVIVACIPDFEVYMLKVERAVNQGHPL